MNLAVTPSEFAFYVTLKELADAGAVPVPMALACEWQMMRRGYVRID